MITQHSEYGSITADIQNLVANSISVLDSYILMQTGQYEWRALIKNQATNEVEEIIVTRSSGGSFGNNYTVRRVDGSEFKYQVNNEYYVYSNVGYGKSLDIPSYEGVRTYGITALTCLVFLMVVFKGGLFKCLRR